MGNSSSYSSPKTSYESSYSGSNVVNTPKSGSYESSKVSGASSFNNSSSAYPYNGSSVVNNDVLDALGSNKDDLNSFRNLITRYLEINEGIEKTTETLSSLEQEKAEIEEKLSSNPEFEKFSAMFNSINTSRGPKR